MALGRRVAMALVGVTVLAAYAGAATVVLLALLSLTTADVSFATLALGVAAATVAVGSLSYRYGTARILAQLDAVPLSVGDAPDAYRLLDRLAAEMDVDVPQLYVARMSVPNAVSLGGPRGGAIVVDESLFRFLDAAEFEGVLAHELAHIEGRDSLVQTVAFTVARTLVAVVAVVVLPVALLAKGVSRFAAWTRGDPAGGGLDVDQRVGAIVVFVFVAFVLVVRARSRKREFAADERAVDVTGNPLELASALRKIERASEPPGLLGAFSRRREDETRWLATHPALDERIERLRERASETAGWHRVELR